MLRILFRSVSSAICSLSLKSLGKQTLDSRKTPELYLMLRSVQPQARDPRNSGQPQHFPSPDTPTPTPCPTLRPSFSLDYFLRAPISMHSHMGC